MSSSAVDVVNGIAPPLSLDPIAGATQTSTKPQAPSTQTSAAANINGTQQILLIPTKPPLSAKVMAQLLGESMSLFGTTSGESARDLHQAHNQPTTNTNSATNTATTTTTTTTTSTTKTTSTNQQVPSLV